MHTVVTAIDTDTVAGSSGNRCPGHCYLVKISDQGCKDWNIWRDWVGG